MWSFSWWVLFHVGVTVSVHVNSFCLWSVLYFHKHSNVSLPTCLIIIMFVSWLVWCQRADCFFFYWRLMSIYKQSDFTNSSPISISLLQLSPVLCDFLTRVISSSSQVAGGYFQLTSFLYIVAFCIQKNRICTVIWLYHYTFLLPKLSDVAKPHILCMHTQFWYMCCMVFCRARGHVHVIHSSVSDVQLLIQSD